MCVCLRGCVSHQSWPRRGCPHSGVTFPSFPATEKVTSVGEERKGRRRERERESKARVTDRQILSRDVETRGRDGWVEKPLVSRIKTVKRRLMDDTIN